MLKDDYEFEFKTIKLMQSISDSGLDLSGIHLCDT